MKTNNELPNLIARWRAEAEDLKNRSTSMNPYTPADVRHTLNQMGKVYAECASALEGGETSLDYEEVDAGDVPPGPDRFVVTHTHKHPTLNVGDVVVMRCVPKHGRNTWVRVEDSTTHHICGASEQYVHVSPASEEGA